MRLSALAFVIWTTTTVIARFRPEFDRLQIIQQRIEELAAEEESLEAHLQDLQEELHWIQTFPEYSETLARDRLDLYLEGETVFRIISPSPPR